MVVRRRRKKNKQRGNRTHGGGGTKNRRGSGSRGGVGRAGSHKHKFSKYYATFGVKRMFKAKAKEPAINLEQVSGRLAEWVANGKARNEAGTIILDGKELGFGKVLGKGSISEKVRFVNARISAKAASKIEAAGGTAEAEAGEDEFEAESEEGPEEPENK
ncbi:MAG: uL15 family ribosomal protein [Candidatus Diapherotrites archaeon]|uniref:Large ribosomal subunit protein uL15 n=1 Tax=Candidatus Iainarchaeum sp. TaxID=3101447 RepID=A0A8T3YJB8_9ARCH|nr:uL15 family ribosomal protein [Candidatus Diapherotrites archaeon]